MNRFNQLKEGETPISFAFTGEEKIPIITMPPVDVKSLIEEDEKTKSENFLKPFRFGYAIDVDIDIKRDGLKKNYTMVICGC